MAGSADHAQDVEWRKFVESLFSLGERSGSLVGEIAAAVGTAIVSGDLLSGDDLNSVELAKRFNTSRTPVREALMILEKEELVLIPPRRRPQVAPMHLAEMQEIYRIRELLLANALTDIVSRAEEEELAAFPEIVESSQGFLDGGSLSRAYVALTAFHDRVIEISGDGTLKKILDRFRLQTTRVRFAAFNDLSYARRDIEAHRLLAEALVRRDEPVAVGYSRSIVRNELNTARHLLEFDAPEAQARPVKRKRRRGAQLIRFDNKQGAKGEDGP